MPSAAITPLLSDPRNSSPTVMSGLQRLRSIRGGMGLGSVASAMPGGVDLASGH